MSSERTTGTMTRRDDTRSYDASETTTKRDQDFLKTYVASTVPAVASRDPFVYQRSVTVVVVGIKVVEIATNFQPSATTSLRICVWLLLCRRTFAMPKPDEADVLSRSIEN